MDWQNKISRIDSSKGFTFVEMMVVMMIMAILFGAGYANYRAFSRGKAIESVAEEVASDIKLTKELASSGKKECNDNLTEVLNGYRFIVSMDSDTYRIETVCSASNRTIKEGKIKNATFSRMWEYGTCSDSGTRSTTTNFVVKTLGEGLDIDSSGCIKILVEQNKTGYPYTVQVSQTGVVTVTEGGS